MLFTLSCGLIVGGSCAGIVVVGIIAFVFQKKLKLVVNCIMSERTVMLLSKVFKFCVALYTIIELFQSLAQLQDSGKLALAIKPESDRCVPLFSTTQQFVSDHPSSIALYSYVMGRSTVRLCTDENASTVDTAFPSLRFNPLLNCNCSLSDLNDYCIPQNTNLSCAELLDTPPTPNGVLFHNGIACPAEDDPVCAVTIAAGSSELPDCPFKNVFAVRRENSNLRFIYWCVVAVPIIIVVLQWCCLSSVIRKLDYQRKSKSNDLSDEEKKLDPSKMEITQSDFQWYAYAMESPVGTVYGCFYHDNVEERMAITGWLCCLAQDLCETTIIPIIAVYGCPICTMPQQIALIIVKTVKMVAEAAKYFFDDEESPRKDAGQALLEQLLQPCAEGDHREEPVVLEHISPCLPAVVT